VFGWLYIKNELNQKGVCATIINELNKNHEIDWYLQAELAYNKRFNIWLDQCFSYEGSSCRA
jgi:regulatory protein